MKILVTGANGLLGSNVVRELLARGADVRVLIRSTSNTVALDGLSIERVYGDITNQELVFKATYGCEIIIHVASSTSISYNNVEKYRDVNIDSVDHLIKASKKNGIRRLIYVSSAGTIGYGSLIQPGTEKLGISDLFSNIPYVQSKKIAEEKILGATKDGHLDAVVVNPSFIIGKYDSKPSSGKIILMSYQKKFLFVAPGGKNFVYAKDAAIAIVNAIHLGRSGECYLLTNENLSFEQFYSLVENVSKYKPIKISLSKPVLYLAGLIGNFLSLLGIQTAATQNNLRTLCVDQYYDNSKAIKELELPTTPIEKAIKDSADWFIANKYIKCEATEVNT